MRATALSVVTFGAILFVSFHILWAVAPNAPIEFIPIAVAAVFAWVVYGKTAAKDMETRHQFRREYVIDGGKSKQRARFSVR